MSVTHLENSLTITYCLSNISLSTTKLAIESADKNKDVFYGDQMFKTKNLQSTKNYNIGEKSNEAQSRV